MRNVRPLSVTILAWVYIVVGTVGFAYHFTGIYATNALRDGILTEVVEALAIVSGAFMLRGQNWARWLAIAWMAFHVVLIAFGFVMSAFGAFRELAIHFLFFSVITWILFRPAAVRYFRGVSTQTGHPA
jgi:hypothetical protein